jgi:hypothetical protein
VVAKVRDLPHGQSHADASETIMSPMSRRCANIRFAAGTESDQAHHRQPALEDRISELDHIREGIHEHARGLEKRLGGVLQLLDFDAAGALHSNVSRAG